MAGYHLKEIPRGEIGHFSKIVEEFLEFTDALEQKSHIMALVELSDLVGSIQLFLIKSGYDNEWSHITAFDDLPIVDEKILKHDFKLLKQNISITDYKYFFNTLNSYLKNYNMNLNELIIMSNITQRVFTNGYRTSRTT